MKYIWEAKDIKTGIMVTKDGISEVWMIGYRVDAEKPDYLTTNSLSDGKVSNVRNATDLAQCLTNGMYVPYTGPVPKKEK